MKQLTFIMTKVRVDNSGVPGSLHCRWNSMVTRVSRNPYRQSVVRQAVSSDLEMGRKVLCLCDRLNLANYFYSTFNKSSYATDFLQGSVRCTERLHILKRLEEGKTQLLVSTKVAETLDASIRKTPLNTLHLVTPTSVTVFRQRIHLLNQEDIFVRYYVDKNDWLKGVASKMRRAAEKLGWEIETLECYHYLRRERSRRDKEHEQDTFDHSPPRL